LTAVRRKLAEGGVQALLVSNLTFLGVSLNETAALAAKMSDAMVDLIAETEGIDSTTPEGAA
jgi:DNA invertase Pin-like site-specific DNA recombinase